MNVIGIMVPKIVSLLTIWIPPYGIVAKLILTAIWIAKLVADFDYHQPGHSGKVYKLTNKLSDNTQMNVVLGIELILPLIFIYVAFRFEAWIPLAMGILSVINVIFWM